MKIFHEDADFDAQLQRTLIGAYTGTADLGEAFAVASRVPAGDYDRWYQEWSTVAGKARDIGSVAESRGRRDLAVSSYLRSAEYHRQAYFFLRHDLGDQRVTGGYRAQREAFRAAMRLLLWPGDPIQLNVKPVHPPTNGSGNGSSNGHRYAPPLLEGYVFRPSDDDVPRPTIMFPCGFDSTSEEGWKYGARAAVDLGFNAVTFAGPGQGELLYAHRIPMRPDFESVVTPLVNWLVGEPYVDPAGLVLLGRSFGGFLAPRAAANEHRLAALVADPGQFDLSARFRAMFSEDDWAKVLDADPEMDAELEKLLEPPRDREMWGSRMAVMGAKTFGEWARIMTDYTLVDHAPLITCPTLVTEGEGDFASQSQEMFDALTCEKVMKRFSEAEGAGGHCEGMGQQLWQDYVYNWILDITNRRD